MKAKVIPILIYVLTILAVKSFAADTLVVIFDKQQFVQGDSIEMEVYMEPFTVNRPAQTLHLWIDNVKTGQRWKFRYPFSKGRYKFSLKIDGAIPDGAYAFNFLLQDKFLSVKGKLKNVMSQEKEINYVARAKNKSAIIDGAALQPNGDFEINNLYFTDSLFFGFSPVQKSKENKLKISLETPIDSMFIPVAATVELIAIGRFSQAYDLVNYKLSMLGKKDKELLQEVTVQTKEKSKRKKFEDENVSGLFDAENAITLDFSENDDLKSFTDIFSYLEAKMPGLRTQINPENGQPVLFWRNEKTDIYVDEFADTDFSPYSVSMQDIEMIKIYRSGNRMGLIGLGGSIAIYTKRRSSRPGNKLSNYSFYVKGYTPKAAEWK